MKRHRIALLALCLTGMTACATPTNAVYGPIASNPSGSGYSEIRIEDDRWRVRYTGRGNVTRDEVERLALRRAGELALANGYDWVSLISSRSEDNDGDDDPVRGHVALGQSFGSRGYRGTSVGLGVSFSPQNVREITVSIEVIMGRGEDRPEGAYHAQPLANTLN